MYLAHSITESDGKKFAIKSIRKSKVIENTAKLKNEVEILQALDHPNAVKLYEIVEDKMHIHLVMEYCSGGEILQRVLV